MHTLYMETGVESLRSIAAMRRERRRLPLESPLTPVSAEASSNVPVESTASLVSRAQAGDAAARELLFARFIPALRRWARGRLPISARDLVDTHDIVQEAALSTVRNLDGFTPADRGAFMAYLREAVHSKITDHIRRAHRRPAPIELPACQPANGETPLEHAIGRERIERYESALSRLSVPDRAVLTARLELQQSYDEIAQAIGKPNANAARSAFVRALERLVRGMGNGR